MPILQHHPWHIKSYNAGADTDHDKELATSQEEYVDSRNGRLRGGNGSNRALEKIKGEVIHYPANFTVGNYFCIYTCNVNDDIVDIWADKNFIEDPLIRVNGVVVCKSPKLGFRSDRPLQGDTNDSCVGGEFYVTDFEQAPYIFSVKDLVESLTANPTKYFSGFNPELYKATLRSPLDIPVFQELVNVGGGGGLPHGTYAYSIRYVSVAGDKTNFSVETPTIDIPANNGSDSGEYPFVKTFGGSASPSFKSAFAIKLRFRITNIFNYSYIEVRRIAYNQGAGLTFVPAPKIIAKIPITPGQISIQTFIDPVDAFSEENILSITDQEDLQQFSTFKTCKTLRYYNKRLVLMNLKYPSRDVGEVKYIEDPDGTVGFPIIRPLYKQGHSDAFNYTYYKDLMSGERHNYGTVIFDGAGGPSFAIPMTAAQQADIHTAPNHRTKLGTKALNFCVTNGRGAPLLADKDRNLNYVYEVWDLNDAIQKFGADSFNICNEGIIGNPADPYLPLTPKNDADTDVLGHRFQVNINVGTGAFAYQSYNPKGFGLNIWTRGIAFNGLKSASLPDWARAFSIVKTKSAKRVVCQGIGIYKLSPAVKSSVGLGYNTGITKPVDELHFHSADIQHGFVDAATLSDMQSNPGNYKVQLLSPVGYFSEVYNNILKTLQRDRSADVVTYARVQDENGNINPTETSGQVLHGKYLNSSVISIPATTGPDNGDHKYGLTSFTTVTEGRNTYYTIRLDGPVYGTSSQGGSKGEGWDINEGKDFKEPFYILNIIRDGAEPPTGNTTNYFLTGHYQKIVSIIGKADGNAAKFDLVDERWEDCMPNKRDVNKANINTYLFIEDTTGVERVWLNVRHKSLAQRIAIFNALQTFGVYNDGTYDIYGVYTSYEDGNDRIFGVEFSILDTTYNQNIFIPQVDSLIKVKYDERFPIETYPGDHYVGETVFAPIDRYSPGDDSEPDETQQFLFASGLPYHRIEFNNNYKIMIKSYGPGNNVQDVSYKTKLDYIRQWVIMYPTESRAAQQLMWDAKFPNRHYVMRPHKYKITSNMSTDNPKLYSTYFSDYPNEENYWGYGGFHIFPANNSDYSATLNDRIYTSKPLVGFKEQRDYCSRIIWSLERDVNAQDSPGLKTFPSLNVRDISDNQGCIKYAYDSNSGKGSNLYAVCSRGICLLVTNKATLSDANAGQLAYMKTENFINEEYWLSKDVGMNDETWRSAAETSSAVYGNSRSDTLFFANKESAYAFVDNSVIDIAKNEFGYHNTIFNQYSKVVKPDYKTHICAGYDRKHEEYWLHIDTTKTSALVISGYPLIETSLIKEENKLLLLNGMDINITDSSNVTFVLTEEVPDEPFSVTLCNNGTGNIILKNFVGAVLQVIPPGVCYEISVEDGEYQIEEAEMEPEEITPVKKTFTFNQPEQTWQGYFDYTFDKFLPKYHEMYGQKSLQTYKLNEGFQINGASIEFEAVQSHNPEPASDKEFIRVKINSSNKPTRVEFFKEFNGTVLSFLDPSQGPMYLKNYGGFEQYVPRTVASVNVKRPRIQGRLIFTKIFHNLDESFVLKDSGIQYKKIK